MEIRLALDVKAALGEGPVWCPRENALYWVDILEPALKRFVPATGETTSPAMPSVSTTATTAPEAIDAPSSTTTGTGNAPAGATSLGKT